MEEHVTHVPVQSKRVILRGGTLIEGLLQNSSELLEVLEALQQRLVGQDQYDRRCLLCAVS